MLEAPSPLLGRDVLSKVQASVFMHMEPALSLPLIEQKVNPKMWADGKTLGQAQNAVLVIIQMFKLDLEKTEEPETICWIIEKAREFQKSI